MAEFYRQSPVFTRVISPGVKQGAPWQRSPPGFWNPRKCPRVPIVTRFDESAASQVTIDAGKLLIPLKGN